MTDYRTAAISSTFQTTPRLTTDFTPLPSVESWKRYSDTETFRSSPHTESQLSSTRQFRPGSPERFVEVKRISKERGRLRMTSSPERGSVTTTRTVYGGIGAVVNEMPSSRRIPNPMEGETIALTQTVGVEDLFQKTVEIDPFGGCTEFLTRQKSPVRKYITTILEKGEIPRTYTTTFTDPIGGPSQKEIPRTQTFGSTFKTNIYDSPSYNRTKRTEKTRHQRSTASRDRNRSKSKEYRKPWRVEPSRSRDRMRGGHRAVQVESKIVESEPTVSPFSLGSAEKETEKDSSDTSKKEEDKVDDVEEEPDHNFTPIKTDVFY